jgi:hypothetical protein
MKRGIETVQDAIELMKRAKFVLRYNSTPTLPLTSMYAAVSDKRRAIELTNALLASKEVVETNVVANRLVLVHRDIVPALYALRVRLRPANLSEHAQRAFDLIEEEGSATAGDVRRLLGVRGTKRPDAADRALAELQRDFLVDRGPSSVPKKGIPYLSQEGFPYRVFEKAHPDLVQVAKKMRPDDAVQILRDAAGAIPSKKLASMFKLVIGTQL